MSEAFAELARVLRAEPPESLRDVGQEQLEQLAGLVRAARRQQAAQMHQASLAAVKAVPLPLRPIAKKAILG